MTCLDAPQTQMARMAGATRIISPVVLSVGIYQNYFEIIRDALARKCNSGSSRLWRAGVSVQVCSRKQIVSQWVKQLARLQISSICG